jgi:ferredoxin
VSDLNDRLKKLAFEEGDADLLLVMSERLGNVGPEMVGRDDELGTVRMDVPYQLTTVLTNLLPYLQKAKVAIICRRCDERALAELAKRDIIDETNIVRIGLACSQEQVQACRCTDCVPSRVDFGEPAVPCSEDTVMAELSSMSVEDRMEFWIRQFRKCNKCFGCTLNCPVCFCDDCVLEERTYTPEEGIPPGLAFHLIRSYHMADKCVECGECERSCPANIPLLALRKMVNRDMKDLFGYTSGDKDRPSPLLTTLDEQPLEGDEHAC